MPLALRSVTVSVVIAEISTFGWVIVVILALLSIGGLIGLVRFLSKGGDDFEDRNNEAEDDYGGNDFGTFGGDDFGRRDFDTRP